MAMFRSISKHLFAATDRLLRPPAGPRVLIYHRVGVTQARQMELPLEDFEWQLEWLSRRRRVVGFDEALSEWNSPASDQLVVLTFDDGYPDTYKTAFPLLKAYGFPFTVYVSTSFVGHSANSEDLLTWEQLGVMVESGLATIGAHTHSHVDLRDLDEEEIAAELETSNSIFESRLGFRPHHFAYPWGYWAGAADPLVRREYSSSVLGAPPISRTPDFDPYSIHRFPIQLSDGTRWFEARLEGGLLMEEELRRRIRGYRGP